MIAVVWHIVGIVFSLCILFVIALVVCCAVGDWRRTRARQAEQRAVEVRLARSREVPTSLIARHPAECRCGQCQIRAAFVCSVVAPCTWDRALTELGETA